MGFNAKQTRNKSTGGGGNFKPDQIPDAGTYEARLVAIVDIGLQAGKEFKGDRKPDSYQIMPIYELMDEYWVDEETGEENESMPFWVSEEFPLLDLELDLATSTKRYHAFDPDEVHGGDWEALLGMPCMITIGYKPNKKDPDRPYQNVLSVNYVNPKKAKKIGPLVNESFSFDLDDPCPNNWAMLNGLRKWRVKQNLEFKGSALEEMINGLDGDSAPKAKAKPKKVAQPVVADDDDWDDEDVPF